MSVWPVGGARAARRSPTDPAFSAQVVAHLDALFAAALRLTRDRPRAEDLVQDTCVKALRFTGRFEPGTNLRAWLFTILHNTYRNGVRSVARDPVEVDSEVVERAQPADRLAHAPDAALLRDVLAPEVRAALDAVPDLYRQAVWLRDVEELVQEIAEILSVPVGTVMSRIARGRRLLYDRLADGREPTFRRKASNG